MSAFTANPHLTVLDETIDSVFTDLNSITADDEKYDKMSNQLIKLIKLREELTNRKFEHELKEDEFALKEKEHLLKTEDHRLKVDEFELKKEEFRTKPKISYETWATIGANIAGIVMILGHERAHVVATKALGFVSKLK